MDAGTRGKLRDRVVVAAESALARQGHASAIDVLTGLGWLDPTHLKHWQQGRLACLEQGIQTHPSRIAEALNLFRARATEKQLCPAETSYVARTPARPVLRFTASGDPATEQLYRMHWHPPDLSGKRRFPHHGGSRSIVPEVCRARRAGLPAGRRRSAQQARQCEE
jgi:hypothetical protein